MGVADPLDMGQMKLQFQAIFYKLGAQSKRPGALAFHLLNLLLPVAILAAVHVTRKYANDNIGWANQILTSYVGIEITRAQFLAVLSSCLDYALVWSFMLLCLFSLPMQTSAFVHDRVEGLRNLLSSMGLGRVVYWGANGAFLVITLLVNLAVLVLGAVLLELPIILKTDKLFLTTLLVATAVAYVGMAAVLSNALGSTRIAVMVGFMACLVLVIALPCLNFHGFENEMYPPFKYMAFPPFAAFRALHLMAVGCVSLTSDGSIDNSSTGCLQSTHFHAAADGLFSGQTWILEEKEKLAAQSLIALVYLVVECGLLWACTLLLDVALREQPHVPLDHEAAHKQHGRSCVVQVSDVKKQYLNGFQAVKGVSMDVFSGDSIGLLGPNGAGKTTMCSMVTGLMSPSSGSIKVWNSSLQNDSQRKQGSLGICAQHTTLFPDLTVLEHLLTFSRIKTMSAATASAHVAKLLEQVGLADKAHCFPHQLSGGMRRKLAICLAVVGQPGLVVLDEPSTGLDPQAREAIWDIVRQSDGGCNLITTHMLEEAEAICTNIYVMTQGSVVAQGSPQQLKEKYGSGYALNVECTPDRENQVIMALAKILKNPGLAPRKRTRAGQLEFGIGSDTYAIGTTFQLLSEGAAAAGISQWGISQSTLQDAYMTIVKQPGQPTQRDKSD